MLKIHSVNMRAGKFMLPVTIEDDGERLYFNFPFNRPLMAEIKALAGSRWHGYDDDPRKVWSAKKCERNIFQLAYLCGKNPYSAYDGEPVITPPNREILMEHQGEMTALMLARHRCIIAGEMGTGKTLAAIEAMEKTGYVDWVWVGPKLAVEAVKLEFELWKTDIAPIFLTYDRMRSLVQSGELSPPSGIIWDEAAKLKNPTSQRSVAAAALGAAMLKENPDAYIILMSGACAPRDPTDWWHICEIACPGFLREGDVNKFRKRMALVENAQSITGAKYPKFITWLDNPNKCAKCGQSIKEHTGNELVGDHAFEASVDEIQALYHRMKGLVGVWLKKDCTGLPEKIYRVIKLKPTQDMLRAAQLIKNTSTRVITALTLLRELSDGFQYTEVQDGDKTCDRCGGKKEALEFFDPENPDEYPSQEAVDSGRCRQHKVQCPRCKGTGMISKMVRGVVEIATPKDQLLIDLLDEHEGIGRFVVYAGFKASVDKCVRIALKHGWDVIRADGRGIVYLPWQGQEIKLEPKEILREFQTGSRTKICFIGQPGAAGSGLTLTASPSEFFYSNPFDGDARIQSEDRIHRIGMSETRGATIIDCVHLPIDAYIQANLKAKKDMLNITMGKFRDVYDSDFAQSRRF